MIDNSIRFLTSLKKTPSRLFNDDKDTEYKATYEDSLDTRLWSQFIKSTPRNSVYKKDKQRSSKERVNSLLYSSKDGPSSTQ